MKNNNPVKNNPKTDNVATSKTNVCGIDNSGKGKATDKEKKGCKDKVDSAMDQMDIPGAEAALPK